MARKGEKSFLDKVFLGEKEKGHKTWEKFVTFGPNSPAKY